MILLFFTGFFWSWGAELSQRIAVYEKHHSKPFHFWGAYHRFNRFVLGLVDSEMEWVKGLIQGSLAFFFFFFIFILTNTWKYAPAILGGGLSYMILKFFIMKIKNKVKK